MSRSLDQANRAISAVRDMPYGVARTQAAERQVRLVEEDGPAEARAYALSTLVEAYHWGGEVDRSFVAFARLLRWYDERPDAFDETDRFSLHWTFKWMVSSLADFPTVSADQIDRTLADMERRFRLAGLGLDAVAYERFAWARDRGAADAEEAFEAWRRSPRDEYSQCEACEPGDQAMWLVETGRVEEGLRLVEATLARNPRCATEPAAMLALATHAYVELGRADDAVRAYRRAVAELARSDSDMAWARGRLIAVLARTGQPARALRRLADDRGLLTTADTPGSRLAFLLGAGTATHVLRATAPDAPVDLGVPAATVAELDDWLHAQALELAAAFDARNGGRHRTDEVEAAWCSAPAGITLDLDVILGSDVPGDLSAGAAALAAGPAPAGPGPAEPAPARRGMPGPADLPVSILAAAPDPLAEAERLLAAGDAAAAVPHYLAAAADLEARGLLAEAGFAWAEAAHAAQGLGDGAGASRAYRAGVDRLVAGGVDDEHVGPVVLAWAGAAAEAGEAELVLPVAQGLVERLTADGGAPLPVRRLAADAGDVVARLLATLGRTAEAAQLAEEVAEAYAHLGRVRDAAHAFWLAGRLRDGDGDVERAVWCLESAVEGFGLARARAERGNAASDLVALLHRTGQHARAEQLAAELTDRR